MNPTIVRLSAQALLGRRRGLVLVLIPALVVALAVVIRALTEEGVGYEVVDTVGFALALPLVALLAASAVLRGSYHLYQGYGGFFGNLVMGLIFGWWFQRTRRVLPLVIAHTLLDAISFVGYIYLKPHISWI